MKWLSMTAPETHDFNQVAASTNFRVPAASPKTPDKISEPPLVAILLCTYNGARFIKEQLESIHNQVHNNVKVWASDDGSSDQTINILRQYRTAWGDEKLNITSGPQKGFAANFLSLTCNPDIQADFFAFADQDDIWQPKKLSQALTQLQAIPASTPALYCARTQLIDEANNKTGYSPLYKRRPSFNNALVQSLASGNSMVMNKAARDILCKVGPLHIASHDWWAYMLVTGIGGIVIYDRHPNVLYRQHDQNVLGAPPGWRASKKRISMLLAGRFKNWNDINIQALQQARELLTRDNKTMLENFSQARRGNVLTRVTRLFISGVYRQTIAGRVALIVAAILKKI